jgi:hypothetical protein
VDLTSANWRKSSYSGTESNCVEVAFASGRAAVRDSKDPAGGALVLPSSAFAALVVETRVQPRRH